MKNQGMKFVFFTNELKKTLYFQNRGNVFGTNNFLTSKADVKKQFVHVAAHNIVKELVSLEEGLDCECKQVNPYNAFNVCKEAYSKEVLFHFLTYNIL